MSKQNVFTLNCPRCGTENHITLWDSVNVTLDPDLKERVLNGDLFIHRCTGCSFTGGVPNPCLYHDMDRNLLIYLIPPREDGGSGGLEEMDMSPFPAEMMDGYIMRRVETAHELREKVMIFDSGKDDRVVELYKWYLMESISDSGSGFRPLMAHYDSGEGGQFMVFDREGENMLVPFLPDLYLEIEKEFSPMFDDGQRSTFQAIDDGWAFSIINQRTPSYPPSDSKP